MKRAAAGLVVVAAAMALYLLMGRGGERGGGPVVPGGTADAVGSAATGRTDSSGEPAAAGAVAAAAQEAEGGEVVVGRVVDERRFPAAGVRVVLLAGGRVLRETTSGAAGRFRFSRLPPFEPWSGRAVTATTSGGMATAAVFRSGLTDSPTVDVGTLVLRPAHRLRVRATADGRPVAGVVVKALVRYSTAASATTGPDGAAEFPALAPGAYRLLALRGDDLRAMAAVHVPAGGEVEIRMAPTRSIAVEIVEADGRPAPGIAIVPRPGGDFWEMPDVPATDGEGRTVVRGAPSGQGVSLDVYRGGVGGRLVAGHSVPPGESASRIELPPDEPLRFPVVAGAAPIPPDGTEIALSGGAASARMEGATLVVLGAPPPSRGWSAIAAAPDGTLARLSVSVRQPPGEISFRPPRRLHVHARDEAGRPVSGVALHLYPRGAREGAPIAEVVTAADGTARFAGLWPQVVEVRAPGLSEPVGAADLEAGDGRLDVVVPAEREVEIRFTIDGEPRLPQVFTIRLGAGPSWLIESFEEDPHSAIVRFRRRFDPGAGELPLHVVAEGYLTPPTVLAIPPDGPVAGRAALRRGGEVRLVLTPPADGYVHLRFRPRREDGTWPSRYDSRPDGSVSFRPDGPPPILPPGEWVLEESSTGRRWTPFTVPEGGGTIDLSADLSKSGWASGRVEAPAGTDWRLVEVFPEPEGGRLDAIAGLAPALGGDGSFRIRVPGDRPVRIRPWHPTLVPASDGIAVVAAPRDDLVVKLVPGPTARFTVSGLTPRDGAQARLYAGSPEGVPDSVHPILLKDGGGEFGNLPAGRYTVFFDFQVGAPVLVGPVEFGDGGADLGEIRLEEGSRIRVRSVAADGRPPAKLIAVATREGEPKFARQGRPDGETDSLISGLLPGRYVVRIFSPSGGCPVDRVVTVSPDAEEVDCPVDLSTR